MNISDQNNVCLFIYLFAHVHSVWYRYWLALKWDENKVSFTFYESPSANFTAFLPNEQIICNLWFSLSWEERERDRQRKLLCVCVCEHEERGLCEEERHLPGSLSPPALTQRALSLLRDTTHTHTRTQISRWLYSRLKNNVGWGSQKNPTIIKWCLKSIRIVTSGLAETLCSREFTRCVRVWVRVKASRGKINNGM